MTDRRITRRTLLAGTAAAGGLTLAGLPALASGATMMKFGPGFKDPSVAYHAGRYLMYFSVPPTATDSRWGQAVATSKDGVTWELVKVIARGICAGDAIVLNNMVHLFYQRYTATPQDTICHAASTDGINFSINTTPIFRPTGSWNNGRAIDAEARVWGTELFVYWATRDPLNRVQMLGVHSAPLASDFSPGTWRQRCTGPILKPQLAWEGQCIEAPSIQKMGSTLVMFYAGNYNARPQQIGVAFSTNGLSWTRMSGQPFLRNGAAGTWNQNESGHPGIFFDPITGLTWLYYQGGLPYYLSRRRITWSGHTPILGGY